MIKKPTPYANNPGTTSDSVLREVSDLYGKSIRVSDAHSVVDKHFSHFRADYDLDGNPTRVRYYHGLEARSTVFTLGMAATLGGKYFKLFTAPDNQLVIVWFNLDGANTQPSVPNAFKYIEIPLNSGDDSYMVGLALKMTIDGLYSNYFYAVLDDGIQIQIITSQMGECSPSDPGTSGFTFTQVAGSQELVQDIEIAYISNNPVFNGQTLIGYTFNIYSGKFEKKVEVDTINVNLDQVVDAIDASNVILADIQADTGSIDLKLDTTNSTLNDIYTTLNQPLEITQPVITAGTQNGLVNGPVFINVSNLRLQILAAHDRVQDITYADFGTKDQRVVKIDYSSATFAGFTASKNINYVIDGSRYRRTNITWTIV
jgi:hypothetical protein